jgi:putative hydrolase of the HAD superfamily
MRVENSTVICIDLDDTIYKEIDFFKSAINFLFKKYLDITLDDSSLFLNQNSNWFEYLQSETEMSKDSILHDYRFHFPTLALPHESKLFLDNVKRKKIPLILITDGRSLTQRNKLSALGISDFFEYILISEEFGSEKPNVRNFEWVMRLYKDSSYVYIGDNTNKDFVTPNRLHWNTVCLIDDGRNIHKQSFEMPVEYLPKKRIENLQDYIFEL